MSDYDDSPRSIDQIAEDVKRLWDLPDSEEAKTQMHALLREALERVELMIEPRGLHDLFNREIPAMKDLLLAYDELLDGVRRQGFDVVYYEDFTPPDRRTD